MVEPPADPDIDEEFAERDELDDGLDPPRRWVGRARVVGRAPVVPSSAAPSSIAPSAVAPSSGADANGGTPSVAVGHARVPPSRPISSPAPSPTSRSRPPWGRIALISGLAIVLVTALLGVIAYGWISGVNSGLKRTDPFAAVVGRPAKAADGTINILLLGSDSRDPDAPTDQAGQWRTDTIVLVHIPASHDKAYLISFPRDLWVYVPRSQDGRYGDTNAKINAAYAWGGTPLMISTVESYTGVRLDHLVLIDFAGFIKVTDALGGVDLTVERTITSIHKPYRVFTKGKHHFTGAEALDYIRQRKQFPDGDFARMRHQQEFLKAIMDKAVSRGTMTSPATIKSFVTSVADAITVDKDFSLLDLGWQFHSLRSNDLVFLTSPHQGTATIEGESVVVSDRERALALYDAVAKDTLAQWLAVNGSSLRPGG